MLRQGRQCMPALCQGDVAYAAAPMWWNNAAVRLHSGWRAGGGRRRGRAAVCGGRCRAVPLARPHAWRARAHMGPQRRAPARARRRQRVRRARPSASRPVHGQEHADRLWVRLLCGARRVTPPPACMRGTTSDPAPAWHRHSMAAVATGAAKPPANSMRSCAGGMHGRRRLCMRECRGRPRARPAARAHPRGRALPQPGGGPERARVVVGTGRVRAERQRGHCARAAAAPGAILTH